MIIIGAAGVADGEMECAGLARLGEPGGPLTRTEAPPLTDPHTLIGPSRPAPPTSARRCTSARGGWGGRRRVSPSSSEGEGGLGTAG